MPQRTGTVARRASWWAKHDRAVEHIQELRTALAEFSGALDGRELARCSAIVGDVAHCAIALARPHDRHRAGFPIFLHDYWRRDATGSLSRTDVAGARGRESFDRLTRGFPAGAIEYLQSIQPSRAERPDHEPLALLNRLENADRRRQLSVVAVAHENAPGSLSLSVSGESLDAVETLERIAETIASVLTHLEKFVDDRSGDESARLELLPTRA